MTNATQKSTQVRQDPLHILQIPHQTFHDNHPDNATHVIIITHNQKRLHDITTYITMTHPITITLSHSHNHTTITLTHLTPATVSYSNNSNHCPSGLPARTLCTALTLNTPGLLRGSARQQRVTVHPRSPPRAAPGMRQRHLPETAECTSNAVSGRLSEDD